MHKVVAFLIFASVNVIVFGQSLSPGQIGNNQVLCYRSAPQTLSFLIQPTGGTPPYTYRWQRSNNGSDWYDITGTTAQRQTYSPPVLGKTAHFRCRVTDNVSASATTNAVSISVATDLIAPVIGTDQTIYNGTAPVPLIQVTEASGGSGSYSYRWQVSDDGLSWSDIPGASAPEYSSGALIEDRWFRQWVIDAACGSTAGNAIKISVNPITLFTSEIPNLFYTWIRWDFGTHFEPLVNGVIVSARIFTCSAEAGLHQVRLWRQNDQSVFELIAGPYDWSFTPGTQGWREFNLPAPLTVEANRNYIVSVTNSADNSYWSHSNSFSPLVSNEYIRYIKSGGGGIGTVPLQELEDPQECFFRDVVFVPFSAGSAGQNQITCYNSMPSALTESIPASGGSGNYVYQWQSSADNQNWVDIDGATDPEYQPPSITSSTYYRRAVMSGDFTSYTSSVFINVDNPFPLAQLQSSISIYENTSTNLSVDITGGTPPYTVEYTINKTSSFTIPNYQSGADINTGLLTAGTYEFEITSVTDALGCHPLSSGTPITVTASGTNPVSHNRNALVMFNSGSTIYYSGYVDFIKPYLDWFGIPYDTYDVNSAEPLPDLSDYALIILGHREVYTNSYPLTQLETAISGGTGLYSFDPHLFDFPSAFCANVGSHPSFSSSEIRFNTAHYITEAHTRDDYHPGNDTIITKASLQVGAYSYDLINNTVLASLGTSENNEALMQVAEYGIGRIVKWNSYQWTFDAYLGPVWGMDDLIWRGIVWAARKPFVMQGLPPMVTMRVDDVDDHSQTMNNLEWLSICNDYGLIPWVGVFTVPEGHDPDGFFPKLKTFVDNNLATASPHSLTYDSLIYYNLALDPEFSVTKNIDRARNIFVTNGITISNFLVPHYYYLTADALPGIRDMGVEFLGTKIPYDPVPYPGNWLNNKPYRINRDGWAGTGVPHFYADSINWLNTPFFLCLSEIGDDGIPSSQYEWYPGAGSVDEVIARGVRHLRRSLNSMTLPVLFTHEDQFTMTPSEWHQILSGVTTGVSPYNPEYKSTDDAVKYIRAKSNLVIRAVGSNNGLVTISVAGANDMETKCYLFTEAGGQITHRLVTLPRVQNKAIPVNICVND